MCKGEIILNEQAMQYSSVLRTLFHVTNTNAYLLSPDGSIITAHTPHTLPIPLVGLQQHTFIRLSEATFSKTNQCYFYTNQAQLSYASRSLNDEQIVVIGPFLLQMPDLSEFRSSLLIDDTFIRSLPLIGGSKAQSMVDILANIHLFVPANIEWIEDKKRPETFDIPLSESVKIEYDLIDFRYKLNNEMMYAVQNGDIETVRILLKKTGSFYDFTGRFPNRPVRSTKNILITLNTTLRLAAERGGVPPHFLHQLSEKFAIEIERMDTVNTLTKLVDRMSDEYCTLVTNTALSGYTLLVQKAVRHLQIHYKNSMNMEGVAHALEVNHAHLSRSFKKETGRTMTHYLQMLRIEEAKQLLRTERKSIEWIAGAVGFDDAAYFARVFKKREGISPTEYRDFKKSTN